MATFKSINEVHALMIEHSVFSVMAVRELIVEILFVLFPYIMLRNGLKVSEYEVYWQQVFH